ncbi:MAG: attachment to host cell protein, partial [Allorhizobium sp.]
CIIHGRQDERAPMGQAVQFAELAKRNAQVTLSLVDCGHFVPLPARRQAVLAVYDKVFGEAPEPSQK